VTTTALPESLPSFSAQENALLDLLTSPRPIWVPLPGPQTEGWLTEADELFYGGSAGGGKTDLEIGLALTAHRRSIIFRREYKQLRDIIDRSHEIIGERGRFNQQTNLWRLADGRFLELGAVQFEHDVDGFQGRAHDLKCFDELPQFSEHQYRFLIGWNRTTIPGQRCRIAGAGNPPTSAEGEWVIRRWAPWLDGQHPRPALPGHLRWFAILDGDDTEVADGTPFEFKGETIQPRSRTFIPARLADNPHLERSGYRAILQAFPEPLRSQMLYGDFEAGTKDDPWQVIPTAWIRAAQARWTPNGVPDGPQDCVGVDVARGGADKTVLSRRYGAWFALLEKYPGSDTPDGQAVATLTLKALTDGGQANVDVIGVGASVYDLLRQQRAKVVPINFAESSSARDRSNTLRFANRRAEAYWKLREALDPDKGENLMLPPDSELLADLCAPHWSMRTTGIQVEAKEDIVKRLGRSPDCGDAVVLSAYTPPRWTAL
jgi:hypothetical protein